MRRRRTASRTQLAVLRLLGWRYSTTREAWVHRVGRGRYGPVFRLRSGSTDGSSAVIDDELSNAIVRAKKRHHGLRPRHERRTATADHAARTQQALTRAQKNAGALIGNQAVPARYAPAPPLPQRSVAAPRPVTPVEVQLHDEEPPRVVLVDGRPPMRGITRPAPGGPSLSVVRTATG